MRYLLLSFLMLFTLSCSKEKQQNKSLPSITIAFASWPGFDIIYYTKKMKLFEKYGIEVNLQKYPNQQAVAEALQNGKTDTAFISLWDVAKLHSDNSFDIILATNISAGADGIVAQGTIGSVKQLKGKKISAQKDTVNELILLEALQEHNLSLSDVKIVNVSNEEALPKLYNKTLDAAVLWEPLLTKAKKKIDGNIIFTTREIRSNVIDLLVVNSNSFHKNKELYKKFLFAWFDTMQALTDNREKLMHIVSNETINPNFEIDYEGLKPGTTELNHQLFIDNTIAKSMQLISSLAGSKEHAQISFDKKFIEEAIRSWQNQH